MRIVTVDGSKGIDVPRYAELLAKELGLPFLVAGLGKEVPRRGAVIAQGGRLFDEDEKGVVKFFLVDNWSATVPEDTYGYDVSQHNYAREVVERLAKILWQLSKTQEPPQKAHYVA